MKDEVVEFPHRYRDKTTGQIIDLIREPGEVTEEGTPICRGTLLSDQTEKMLGIETEATPDMALQRITALLLSAMIGTNDSDAEKGKMREIEIGTLKNAGSGWNTYAFRKPFSTTPILFLQPQQRQDVQEWCVIAINAVAPDRFVYMAKSINDHVTTIDFPINYLAIGGIE